jgi:ADP-ribosylglycohydrolase
MTLTPGTLSLRSRIHGCWVGKSVGGTLGLPAEGKMERLHFSFYDPVPTIAPPNDDLELQLVWLHLVEKAGSSLTRADFARAWLEHIHYMWDEYGRCRWNLRRGVPAESLGTFENHFHDGMGSPIRSEIWACLFPGDPDSAAHYASLDASLDHGIEGIAGEVLFAVLQCLVLGGESLDKAITGALRYIPGECETARAVAFVLQSHCDGVPEWRCWEETLKRFGRENFTYAPLNVALTVWALWYGGGDFEKSILLAVNAGYDTDCTAATVGATLGLLGVAIPARWTDPIGEGVFVGSGILDIAAPTTLTELTERTMAAIGKLDPQIWRLSFLNHQTSAVAVGDLPGTILLLPASPAPAVPWANGELPGEVKKARGASWEWELDKTDTVLLVCLASEGARLFVDDQPVVCCPAGLPYIPATHRCPDSAKSLFTGLIGRHQIRVELDSGDENQQASVILAYPDFHLRPWSREELPNRARLIAV